MVHAKRINMKKYKVEFMKDNTYEVIETVITEGERLNTYESAPDTKVTQQVFQGSLSDCEVYIRLHEGGYM